MRTITIMEFRKGPGEFLIDIRRDRASFIITQRGKPVAKLGPIDDMTVVMPDGRILGEPPLTARRPELRRATPRKEGK